METKTKQNQSKYPVYEKLNLPSVDQDILDFWKENDIFSKSISEKEGKPRFTFYEGPPSANGKPGIHHVMARTLKDMFCRYKTLQGFQVHRKGGWDTHGLPIELQVEKKLGITKDDIGKKISIAEYNQACREDVLKFKELWDDLTVKMGYWVDLDNPYITYENNYIESVWNLLSRLYEKKFLYKGFTIQPFSPAAGTGLSSHELNLPGTYQDVKDTTVVAQFKVVRNEDSEKLFSAEDEEVFFLAWTTTPWTLPSNVALAVGKGINYIRLKTKNQYTGEPVTLILGEPLFPKLFNVEGEIVDGKGQAKFGKELIGFEITGNYKGSDLAGMKYEQLLPYVKPEGKAFEVIVGDFVTTEDGTGIVHIAPTFGADDFRVGQQNGIEGLWVKDEEGDPIPLVDRQGKFVKEMGEFAGRYVKNYKDDPEWVNPDIDLAIKLKTENRAFRVEKYEHSYPHCWRTDKPVLYYPLDSWFIKTTAVKDRLVELNKTINWKPASTGAGRFGNWLENLVDWNLSRSRFWGTPLPIWTNGAKGNYRKELCVSSIDHLKGGYVFTEVLEGKKTFKEALAELNRSLNGEKPQGRDLLFDYIVKEGFLKRVAQLPEYQIDLHRPFVDEVIFFRGDSVLVRESDLIDVWFDSGAMPYAQWHVPFENEEEFKRSFPADYIAEGVDQTRGWFFTLHAIAVMLYDSVAYKNVIANGLVLDKEGNKMSKRLGNAVDPFEMLTKYGADATRWYMIGNAPPWDNLKFDEAGITEVQRRFFGTLYNTYGFFALYANIDGFDFSADRVPVSERPEIDRWIMSLLNSLVKKVQTEMDDYEPTRAVREIDTFVVDHLSNWYVRLCRRRFWKGEMNQDKQSAYQTLYECLVTVSKLMSSFAPFYADRLFGDLNGLTGLEAATSVHLADFPEIRENEIDKALEERMEMAQTITSLGHSIRKRKDVNLKIRQPLSKILVPVNSSEMKDQLSKVRDLILSEINVKEIEFLGEDNDVLVKTIKPNFRTLGPKVGKDMKIVAAAINAFTADDIRELEQNGSKSIDVQGNTMEIGMDDVEILNKDIPGWSVATSGKLTVALDVTLTDDLKAEGIARDFVNRIQRIRKDSGFEVTDRVNVKVSSDTSWDGAIEKYLNYICKETLSDSLEILEEVVDGVEIEINQVSGKINIQKSNG